MKIDFSCDNPNTFDVKMISELSNLETNIKSDINKIDLFFDHWINFTELINCLHVLKRIKNNTGKVQIIRSFNILNKLKNTIDELLKKVISQINFICRRQIIGDNEKNIWQI